VGNRAGEATTLNNIGYVYAALGEKQKALEYFTQALALHRAVGNRAGEATTLNNIGGVYFALGEKQKALEYFTQALALHRAVGNRAGEAATLNNIGAVYSDLGEKQKALEYYTQALALIAPWGIGPGKPERSTISARCTPLSARSRRRWSTHSGAGPSLAPWGIGPGKPGRSTTSALHNMVYFDLGEKQKALEYSLRRWPSSSRGGSGSEATRSPTSAGCTSVLARSRRRWSTTPRRWPSLAPKGDRAGEFRTLIYMMRLVNDDLGEKQNPRRR
jgi:tetratricopeptide (TPR) repeat protein